MENTTLLNHLIENSGLPEDKAVKALTVVANFAKERFPILEGTISAYIKHEFRYINPDLLPEDLD